MGGVSLPAEAVWHLFFEEPMQDATVLAEEWLDFVSLTCELIPASSSVNRYAVWSKNDSAQNEPMGARWRFLPLLHAIRSCFSEQARIYRFSVSIVSGDLQHRRARGALERSGWLWQETRHLSGHAFSLCEDVTDCDGNAEVGRRSPPVLTCTPDYAVIAAEALPGTLLSDLLGSLLDETWPSPHLNAPLFICPRAFFELSVNACAALISFRPDVRHARFPMVYSRFQLTRSLVQCLESCERQAVRTHELSPCLLQQPEEAALVQMLTPA